MSASTKQKHVFLEALNTFDLPTETQSIVKVKGPRGNNLHDVETSTGEMYIVTMPVKFRKSVWTKRGDFLIIDAIDEGDKVKGEIIQILNKEQIRYIKSKGLWPKEFASPEDDEIKEQSYVNKDMLPSSSDEDEYETDDDQCEDVNNNKKHDDEFEQKNPNFDK